LFTPHKLNLKIIIVLLLSGVIVTSCQANSGLAAPSTSGSEPSATNTSSPADLYPEEWLAWQAGPHAAGYDLGKGPNTYCARCHSPHNWDPEAKVDPPPNCVSCKFPNEEEVRIAESNPLIPEEDWKGISCDVCHQMEIASTDMGIAWRDAVTGYSESVASPTELCEKCHHDTDVLQYKMDLGSHTHTDFTCVDCHEPHSTRASCGNVGCHDDVVAVMAIYNPTHLGITDNAVCVSCHTRGMDEHTMYVKELGTDDCLSCHINLVEMPITSAVQLGHTIYHQTVSCSACHDATGALVEPNEDSDRWTAVRLFELLGRTSRVPFTSHNLQREVDCLRCHFSGNPWELPTDVLDR
jgi:hypothetical protein